MIKENKAVKDLITKLLSKFKAEGSNVSRAPSPFAKEALQLVETAPFLNIDSYLYFLSEMSVLLLTLNDGNFAMFYGLDNWDEGLNILDYPIPAASGFHLAMDITNADGEILYFSYNSKFPGEDILWIAKDIDGGEGSYSKTNWSFTDVLNLIHDEKLDFREVRNTTNNA